MNHQKKCVLYFLRSKIFLVAYLGSGLWVWGSGFNIEHSIKYLKCVRDQMFVVFQWTGSFCLNSPGKNLVSHLFLDFTTTKYCLVILEQCPLWYSVLRMFQFTGSDVLCSKSRHCRSVVWMCSYTSFVSCRWARKLFMRYPIKLGLLGCGGDQVK
jgi:hypothetical protein